MNNNNSTVIGWVLIFAVTQPCATLRVFTCVIMVVRAA